MVIWSWSRVINELLKGRIDLAHRLLPIENPHYITAHCQMFHPVHFNTGDLGSGSKAIEGFSSETKEPKLHKLGVFWVNNNKKHLIWANLKCFSTENGTIYWWVGDWVKNWYGESPIFEVQLAHSHTIFVKVTPLDRWHVTAALHQP